MTQMFLQSVTTETRIEFRSREKFATSSFSPSSPSPVCPSSIEVPSPESPFCINSLLWKLLLLSDQSLLCLYLWQLGVGVELGAAGSI